MIKNTGAPYTMKDVVAEVKRKRINMEDLSELTGFSAGRLTSWLHDAYRPQHKEFKVLIDVLFPIRFKFKPAS